MVSNTPLQTGRKPQLGHYTFSRFLSLSSSLYADSSGNKGKEVGQVNQPPKPAPDSRTLPRGPLGVPTALDKIFLVWSGQYKSKAEIPRHLEGDQIHRARSFARIRINIGFLFIAAAGAAVAVYMGKREAARGRSVEQDNLDWHRKVKESFEAKK